MAEWEELTIAALTAAQNAERQIPGAVSAWLEENVDPETGYVLDSSLTVAGAAADAKAAGDAVGELKSAINNTTVSNGQLIPSNVGMFTGYINSSGVFKLSSSYRTLYLPCDHNTVYTATHKEFPTSRQISLSANVPAENGTSSYLSALNTENKSLTFNSGEYNYICMTFYRNSYDSSIGDALSKTKIQKGNVVTEGFDYGGILPVVTYGGLDSVMQAKQNQNEETTQKLNSIYDVHSGKNIADISKAIDGYYVAPVGVVANASYKYIDYFEVKPGTSYIMYQRGGSNSSVSCVFYDANKVVISSHSPFSSATSPATAKYMRLSCAITTTMISVVEGSTALEVPYWKKLNGDIVTNHTAPITIKSHSDSMSANDAMNINIPDIKKNGVYGLHMNVTTMGVFTFGAGRTKANRSAFVTVNDTNIIINYYANSETKIFATFAHGLTIANELDLVIVQANNSFGESSIRLSSSGSSYKVPQLQYWKGNDTPLTLQISSGTYTDVDMTYYCADYTKDLYIFGDSYLDHWPRYVMNTAQNNYQNFLLDGYGGRASLDAVTSLRIIEASHGIPKKIFWCMGMNDGDTNAVNANWLKALTIIIDFCNQYNVELILCTIPNVATVDNTYKNAYIRSSGYRYVDLAKAVGSDVSTSWFTGLLSNDGVHPSTAGDKMIADFMISQVPEMI